MREKVIMSWSSGKDSALALYEIQKDDRYEVVSLLTTITKDYDRISMHGIQRVLLEEQARSLGIELEKVYISKDDGNEDYESKMEEVLTRYKGEGVGGVVFGDIFLEDLRKHREDNLARVGMRGIFPIWEVDTGELSERFVDLGFKAIITCVDSEVMDKKFAGRDFDSELLAELPENIDPCGENGEFHSFVHDGPNFSKPISHTKGEVVLRENRFCFCDILPSATSVI
ncbi:MAG: diphthine--ammonia ligase [Planctomycetes bacterium]|nr:diphthine--ammonia ligase [Planctomycetota bacterium]